MTAPLVLAGFGVTAPDRGYDDYRTVDPKGKIVVLLTGAPSSLAPAERAHYATSRIKFQNAVNRGAVGVLVVRTRDQSFPWDRLTRQVSSRRHALARSGRRAGWTCSPPCGGRGTLGHRCRETLRGRAGVTRQVLTTPTQGSRRPSTCRCAPPCGRSAGTSGSRAPTSPGCCAAATRSLRDEVVVLQRAPRSPRRRRAGEGRLHLQRRAGQRLGQRRAARGGWRLRLAAQASPALGAVPRRHRRGEGLLGSDYFAEYPTVPLERIVANVNIDGLGILYPCARCRARRGALDAGLHRRPRREADGGDGRCRIRSPRKCSSSGATSTRSYAGACRSVSLPGDAQ